MEPLAVPLSWKDFDFVKFVLQLPLSIKVGKSTHRGPLCPPGVHHAGLPAVSFPISRLPAASRKPLTTDFPPGFIQPGKQLPSLTVPGCGQLGPQEAPACSFTWREKRAAQEPAQESRRVAQPWREHQHRAQSWFKVKRGR